MIPKPAGQVKSQETWHDESLWSEATYMQFDLVPEHLRTIFVDFLSLTPGALSTILATIRAILGRYSASLNMSVASRKPTKDDSLSGALTYIHSGQV